LLLAYERHLRGETDKPLPAGAKQPWGRQLSTSTEDGSVQNGNVEEESPSKGEVPADPADRLSPLERSPAVVGRPPKNKNKLTAKIDPDVPFRCRIVLASIVANPTETLTDTLNSKVEHVIQIIFMLYVHCTLYNPFQLVQSAYYYTYAFFTACRFGLVVKTFIRMPTEKSAVQIRFLTCNTLSPSVLAQA